MSVYMSVWREGGIVQSVFPSFCNVYVSIFSPKLIISKRLLGIRLMSYAFALRGAVSSRPNGKSWAEMSSLLTDQRRDP